MDCCCGRPSLPRLSVLNSILAWTAGSLEVSEFITQAWNFTQVNYRELMCTRRPALRSPQSFIQLPSCTGPETNLFLHGLTQPWTWIRDASCPKHNLSLYEKPISEIQLWPRNFAYVSAYSICPGELALSCNPSYLGGRTVGWLIYHQLIGILWLHYDPPARVRSTKEVQLPWREEAL